MGHYHEDQLFLAHNKPSAIREASRLSHRVEAGLRVWRVIGGILHFDAAIEETELTGGTEEDEVDRSAIEQQVRSKLGTEYETFHDRIVLDFERMRRVHALARASGQPWAYWFHCGDHGPLYEYCYCVDPVSNMCRFELNEDFVSGMEPVSPLTKAVRFVGGIVPPSMESEFFGWKLSLLPWEAPNRNGPILG